jgi:hypothetical protein
MAVNKNGDSKSPRTALLFLINAFAEFTGKGVGLAWKKVILF